MIGIIYTSRMNILIIDNGTKYIDQLQQSFAGHTTRVLKYRQHTRVDRDWADMYVLSGGNKPFIYTRLYAHELQLIRETNKPLLGICLGMELLAHAQGVRLKRRLQKIVGVHEITIHLELFGLEDETTYRVFEAHRWTVPKESLFETIGVSEYGAEIIKHPVRHHIGFQFHPEVASPENDGALLLQKAVAYLEREAHNT